MKTREIISPSKEVKFLLGLALVLTLSSTLAVGVLLCFTGRDLGKDYQSALETLGVILPRVDTYVAVATLIQLVFSSITVFLLTLLYSHKIAGPIYRLKMILRQHLEGQDVSKVRFRKGDLLAGVGDAFTAFFALRHQRVQLLREAEQLEQQLPQADECHREVILHRLRGIVQDLEGIHETA